MRTRTVLILAGVLMFAALAGGCSGARQPASQEAKPATAPRQSVAGQAPAQPPAPSAPAIQAPAAGNTASGEGGGLPAMTDQMIIRTVDLGISVKDTQAAADQLKSVVEGLKGYVSASNLYRTEDDLLRGTITVRVPAADVDTALSQIKALAVKVESEKESSQDVGEEYTDLTSRRRNLEATEKELLALLTQVREQGGKADDILAIYRELTNIRGQIEQIQGRMQYLERLTALATINVELIPAEVARPLAEPNWAPATTLREASRTLVRAMQGLVTAGIWLAVVVLPVMVVVLLPLIVLAWALRRWRRGRARPASGAA